MRKLFLSIAIVLLVAPGILSFGAEYYLRNQLANNLGANARIEALDFNHGWLSSTASVAVKLVQQNLIIKTDNLIYHGPVIWQRLLKHPFQSLAWYNIESRFGLVNTLANSPSELPRGSAFTRVDYLGKSHPEIVHPGLDLTVLQSVIFADMARIKASINHRGEIEALLTANQFELSDTSGNYYLIEPQLELALDPALPLPGTIELSANSLSGRSINSRYQTDNIELTGKMIEKNNAYLIEFDLNTPLLTINQVAISNMKAQLSLSSLDHALMEFIMRNAHSMSASIQQNQWLKLWPQVSQLLKLTNQHQPAISFSMVGTTQDTPVNLSFTGKLLAREKTELNPFSLLNSLHAHLDFSIPKSLLTKLNHPRVTDVIQFMQDHGLILEAQNAYTASLSFTDTKLRTNH